MQKQHTHTRAYASARTHAHQILRQMVLASMPGLRRNKAIKRRSAKGSR